METHTVCTQTHMFECCVRFGVVQGEFICHFHRYWFKSSVSINNGTFYCSFLRHDLHSLPKQIVISFPIIGFHKRGKSLKDHQQKSCMANVTDSVGEERQVSALSEQRGGQEGRVWGWRWVRGENSAMVKSTRQKHLIYTYYAHILLHVFIVWLH